MSPPIASVHFGKVRNSLVLGDGTRILHTTDRVSAFDVVLPFEVPGKGEILQALSAWFFADTAHLVENHFVGCLDRTHVLVREALVLPFEFVVRGVLTGSLWRLYEARGPEGVKDTYGVDLSAGLTRNAPLPEPILTPTTKAEAGHDMPVRAERMPALLRDFLDRKGLDSRKADALLEEARRIALALFVHGRTVAAARGLTLVDTKYEFGLRDARRPTPRLVLVDEVHTPDSSRYWLAAEAASIPGANSNSNAKAARADAPATPHQLSKEFLREELMRHFGNPDGFGPALAHNPKFRDPAFVETLRSALATRYREMFDLFLPGTTPFEVCRKSLVPWPVSPARLRTVQESLRLPDRVMIVGNGGRDWALQDFFARQPDVVEVVVAPGRREWTGEKLVECTLTAPADLAAYAKERGVGLVVSGPEAPLCEGLQAACAAADVPCLGPDLVGSSLEASKVLCKEIIRSAGLPTADSEQYGWRELQERAARRIEGDAGALRLPCALKFDGLAAGKGVFICKGVEDLREALVSLRSLTPAWEEAAKLLPAPSATKATGEAQFLVERLLEGEEISVLALCNGTSFRLLPFARDYKRRNDAQTGPNTGGMGSVCPVEVPESLRGQIDTVFRKTLATLAARGTPYRGFLFAGLMVDAGGTAWVLEFNCRLGDPETQTAVAGLGRDFALELLRTARGEPFALPENDATVFPHDGLKRIFVVGASPEYPDASAPKRDFVPAAVLEDGVTLVPTAIELGSRTSGGRAFGYLAAAATFGEARRKAYAAMAQCELREGSVAVKPHYRRDVGAEFEGNMR